MILAHRRGIVTGSGRGIGRAIAERLAADGAAVALFDLEPPAPLPDARSISFSVDITDRTAVSAATAGAAEALGGLDFVVNNAGVRYLLPIAETTEEVWRSTLDVNLTGAFFCAQAAVPFMLAGGGGRIVSISSTAGVSATSERVAYCASKAGLEGMTRAFAVELGRRGVRANCVAPGPIETEMTRFYYEDPTLTEKLVKLIPAGTWAQPTEIASAVAFLLRDDAWFVNGTTLYVDGGWTAGKDVL